MDLTIVVCVYNTPDELLRGCLDSIRASTLPVDSYRILVLDDGSEREYRNLLQAYDVDYHRIPRSGTLRARLHAIDLATGDYVAFVDSDDQVSLHYHLPMLLKAKETGADVVFNDWAFWTPKARYYCYKDNTVARNIDVEEDCLPLYLDKEGRQHSDFVLWNKLYRRSILAHAAKEVRGASLQAPRFMSYGEDTLINFFVFEQAKRVVGVHSGYYFYRIHEGQTVVVSDERRLRGQIDMMATTFAIMSRHVRGRKDAKTLLKRIDNWKGLMARAHYAYARRREFGSVLPYLKERYGVTELKLPTKRDGAVYVPKKLLPFNWAEIDAALKEVYMAQGPVTLYYDRGEQYVYRTILEFVREGHEITYARDADLSIPRAVIPAKIKWIYHPVVYSIGRILLPPGSRLRAWLKRKL